jgi:predicted neuraminidase
MPAMGESSMILLIVALLLAVATYFAAAYRGRSKTTMLESQLSNTQQTRDQLQADLVLAVNARDAAAAILRDREDDCLRLEKEKEFSSSEKHRLGAQLAESNDELLILRQGQAELSAARARILGLQRDLDELKSERQLLLEKLEKQTTEAAVLLTEREQQE